MSDCKEFLDFCAQVGDEAADDAITRVCEAAWDDGKGEGVRFSTIYKHDVINSTLVGQVDIAGHAYGFEIENGNWNGTVVRQWDSDPENIGWREPEPPEPATFVPTSINHIANPELWRVYAIWRREKWFAEKAGGLNYDRHFAPGGKTETYYREWAAKKGMRIGFLSSLRAEAREMLNWSDSQWAENAKMLRERAEESKRIEAQFVASEAAP